jgi:uncharacterized protein YcfJ
MKNANKIFLALILMAVLAGCASPGSYGYNQYPYRGTVTGAAVGAAGGALLGYAADGGRGNGALLGGTLGAVAGGATGYYFDQKRRDGEYQSRPYYNDGYGQSAYRRHRKHGYGERY